MSIDLEGAARLYEEATALTKRAFLQAGRGEAIDGREVTEFLWQLVEHLTLGDRGLVYFTNRSTPQNFLIAQSVNVSILSLSVGVGLGYDTTELNELGVAALLHDIGMVKCLQLAGAPRKLTPKELEEVRKHPQYGLEILEKAKGLTEGVLYVCREHRQIREKKGPSQTEGEEGAQRRRWHEFAQIVGILDIYVAMTQPRPYREAKLSYEAVRELIGASYDIFDTRIMKTLVNQIGIYPIGSWVRLSTREVARVVEQNRNFPLHPRVEILFDAGGEFLEHPRIYDLYQKQVVYIKEPVDYQKFRLSETTTDA